MSHSFINSEAIFEVIGDYPVVDQFDILYSNLQAGTTYDNYVTGTLLYSSRNASRIGFEYKEGQRGLIFSRLLVNQSLLPSQSLDYRTSAEWQPWREKAGIIRFAKIFSNNERFYDSLLPDVAESLAIRNGYIAKLDIAGVTNYVINLSGSLNSSANKFIESFPFESQFSSVLRRKNITEGFIVKKDDAGNELKSPVSVSRVVIRDASRFVGPTAVTVSQGLYWGDFINTDPSAQRSNQPLTTKDTAKILFGFGDNRTQGPREYATYTQPRTYTPMWRYFFTDASNYEKATGPIIRGWKYGLIDGNPHYTSAVFRRDRYGQFRDMLEQRIISATYTDVQNATQKQESGTPEVDEISFAKDNNITLKEGTISYPVTVNFVQQTIVDNREAYVKKLPVETWSSNLSLYVTSSLPFFDGISRNRSEIIIPPNSYSVTSFIDTTGNVTLNIG